MDDDIVGWARAEMSRLRDEAGRLLAEADGIDAVLQRFLARDAKVGAPPGVSVAPEPPAPTRASERPSLTLRASPPERRGDKTRALLNALQGAGARGLSRPALLDAITAQGVAIDRQQLRSLLFQMRKANRIDEDASGAICLSGLAPAPDMADAWGDPASEAA